MCGCEHHWDLNAPCTCQCPGHLGIRAEMQRRAARLADANALRAAEKRAEAAESRARDLEVENARLRALLAEDVALLEELDAAWGGTGEVCS